LSTGLVRHGDAGDLDAAQSSRSRGLWPGSWAGRRELGHVWEIEKREERWAAADSDPIRF
jgi:hypothetical protein